MLSHIQFLHKIVYLKIFSENDSDELKTDLLELLCASCVCVRIANLTTYQFLPVVQQ